MMIKNFKHTWLFCSSAASPIFLCLALLYLVPARMRVEPDMQGGVCSETSQGFETETISVRSVFKKYFLRGGCFTGTTQIGSGETQAYTSDVKLRLRWEKDIFWGSMGYYSVQENRMCVFGNLYMQEDFAKLLILAEDGERFCFPAQTCAQAVGLANRLTERIGFTFA